MDNSSIDQLVNQLADREAIRDCLLRGSLGNDMQDIELWKSAYWPDATEDHAWYKGNAHAFVEETVPKMAATMDEAWHQIGNMLIRLDGGAAYAQSYFFAYCRLKGEGDGRSDLFAGGRYLDQFEKRDGDWRIAHRFTKSDWVRQTADSIEWGKEVMNGYIPDFGTRAPGDPVYGLFGARLNQPPFRMRQGMGGEGRL